MKKVFLAFIILFMSFIISPKAFSDGFLPRYSDSINNYGIGIYLAPKEFSIYAEPDQKSNIVEHIRWNNFGVSSLNNKLSSKNVFIAFIPKNNTAIMTAVDDMENWCQVIYDRKTGAKGWVKITDSNKFLTWLDFMTKYGKASDIYLFLDLPEEYRLIHTAPHENAQVQTTQPFSPDNVKLKFIKGNWMLVNVIDYSKTSTYIGWIRWRTNEGRIFAFPNLKQ
ncbi:MAG: hypothetical protein ACD_20C00410G0002 [uncultured bacterium]|nr:MAG: hypothetical protein ACD_20C00410G0002 [uncultured bacterium]HBH17554.1 hypothetical protein [Cyanobacteria bacterium UBA9579]